MSFHDEYLNASCSLAADVLASLATLLERTIETQSTNMSMGMVTFGKGLELPKNASLKCLSL